MATTNATAREISEAHWAFIRTPPSNTKSNNSGITAKIDVSPSEWDTGSRTCLYIRLPPRPASRDDDCSWGRSRRSARARWRGAVGLDRLVGARPYAKLRGQNTPLTGAGGTSRSESFFGRLSGRLACGAGSWDDVSRGWWAQ